MCFFLAELNQRQDFRHQRTARELALIKALAVDPHPESIALCRNETLDVFANPLNAARRKLNVLGRIADLSADGVLIIDMGGVQPSKPGNLRFKSRLLHQAWIAGRNGFGHGELVGLT